MDALREEKNVYDVVIVGAGPAGLAVAARLREDTPAAIFTDEEHRRYQWLRKYGRHVTLKQVKTGREKTRLRRAVSSSESEGEIEAAATTARDPENIKTHTEGQSMRMVVLDATGTEWLKRWDRLFGAFGISHLRSPLLWHVDPQDRDSLLARAHEQGNPDDLFDIGACVGKEISKHLKKKRSARRGGLQDSQPNVDINERERNDYFTPSRPLFFGHCYSVRDRYGLGGNSGILRQETLRDLDYGVVRGVSEDNDDQPLFTVTTDKTRRYARVVVLAVGVANPAGIPAGLDVEIGGIPGVSGIPGSLPDTLPATSHVFHLHRVPDPRVEALVRAGRPTNVLVVGGGLTSAQIGDLALRRGVTRVWHLMRARSFTVKYFDVDLSWMGKYRNREQARFWSADSDAERLDIIREARGGGSITPHYHRIIKRNVASGRLRLFTETVVTGMRWDEDPGSGGPETPRWHVTTSPAIPDLPPMDYVYFATGVDTEVRDLPYLQKMLQRFPLDTIGGLPCLTEDLSWADGVPLFCAGKLAMLRIGPAAPNIGGIKLAAERVGLAVEDVLRRDGAVADENSHETDYASGIGSKYKCLGELGH